MIAYVKQLANEIAHDLTHPYNRAPFGDMGDRFKTLAEELNRLDPRDFLPAARVKFVDRRRELRALSGMPNEPWEQMHVLFCSHANEVSRLEKQISPSSSSSLVGIDLLGYTGELRKCRETHRKDTDFVRNAQELCESIVVLLDSWGGEGSQAVKRSFAFVVNADLRAIVERDYNDLAMKLLPSEAWKSAVVMAGSILEAIVYDQLTREPARIAAAMAWPAAPRLRGGGVRDITVDDRHNEWSLANLIGAAAHLQIVSQDDADAINVTLRDYRNFVHPRVEIRNAHECTEAEATAAKGMLDMICNRLFAAMPPPP